jgi:ketosteroid isomerase-like protein
MHTLSEDPTYLAGGLVLGALACLIALKLSQQGKYLIWAGAAFGLALMVVVVEQLWVTDNERIEATVFELARGVRQSDADAVAALMTPDAIIEVDPGSIGDGNIAMKYIVGILRHFRGLKITPELLRRQLEPLTFDTLWVSRLEANAGRESRRGTATFRVHASGIRNEGSGTWTFATPASGTQWSLGFREVDGRWKVDRISPVAVSVESDHMPALPRSY